MEERFSPGDALSSGDVGKNLFQESREVLNLPGTETQLEYLETDKDNLKTKSSSE